MPRRGWAETARASLTGSEFGPEWAGLVEVWWVREELKAFNGTTRPLVAKKRPKEIGDWIQRARKYTPPMPDTADFESRWWDWWVEINPAWRGKTVPMLRARDGPWLLMEVYGQNGFLNVLTALK
ncbi:hypothetical protein DFH07DRAFT_743483 [Mycena maculata]|uniref:Uncharacterized protein n=1 Tax=Mycena maculata TaxID=230809 RepID=A0AAD7J2S7_9AGAR|nr:hypothetical protein DFH07DRAFT_743483 [Mycena maculata]